MEGLQCCYSLGHGTIYRSFNQGSNTNRHIHLQIGKQKISTRTKSIFGNVFDKHITFTRWSDRGLRFFGILSGDVIGYRSRFDNMHNKEVESFVFCFMY